MNKPLFEHDCPRCTFLGVFEGKDLYICGVERQTVIARESDEPSDYESGLHFADVIPALGEARKRAIEKGLLK